MRHLSYLTPAETLLLIDPDNASGREMLKLTFLHLFIKKRLKLYLHLKVNKRDNKVRQYKYIELGDKQDYNHVRPHETFYFNLLPTKDTKYLIRHYVSNVFKDAKNEKYFKTKVIESTNVKDYFTQNILQQFYNGFSINNKGTELGLEIKKEITELENIFPSLIKGNQRQAIKIIQSVGANVLLLKGVDISVLNLIDKDLLRELNKKKEEDNETDWDLDLDFFDALDFGNDFELFEFGGGSFGGAGAGGSFDDALDLDFLED